MVPHCHRRAYLALLASALGSVAGCSSVEGPGTAPENGTAGDATTASPTVGDSGQVVVERADAPHDGPLAVFPADLASWLRTAATGETVRAVAPVSRYTPRPVLPRFDHVELRTPAETLGTFAVAAEGGTHYELLVGASEVESIPPDATATPVADLPSTRRKLVRAVIDGARRTVEPQTTLGEWTRHEWFGGYYRHEGTVYRGREVKQTDAAFFSKRLWLVLRLTPVESPPTDPVRLDLSVDATVRDELGDAVTTAIGEEGPGETATVPLDSLSDRSRRFVETTPALLTHTGVLSVSVESTASSEPS